MAQQIVGKRKTGYLRAPEPEVPPPAVFARQIGLPGTLLLPAVI